MPAPLVIVEQPGDWGQRFPEAVVVTAKEYVSQQEYLKLKNLRVINLCRSYRYLSLGYYCSLLAEARQHKVLPSVRTITELSSKSVYGVNIEDLDAAIQRSLKRQSQDASQRSFTLNIFFGTCEERDHAELARQVFDMFRCPILRVEFKLQERWQISAIRPGLIQGLTPAQVPLFIAAFQAYATKKWRNPKVKSSAFYDLAILQNPAEALPPSDRRALRKFVSIGKDLGIEVDLIEKKDFSRLAEYDALFIRETTEIEHYTYRFARRAQNEGMVVIDDPDSILKCTNKIYLAELMAANKIPIPRTKVLKKDDAGDLASLEAEMPYPIVLKIPDGSFSRGVHKVASKAELSAVAERLFAESDVIVAQEYMYTEFDWRIGSLNRRPLFACQYFMSRRHWQIVKHAASGSYVEGDSKTWPIAEVPAEVVDVAMKAANLIGDGLYGIDLKASDRGVVVMEINDNPNLEAGVEDECLGDDLYRIILEEFVRRLELQRGGGNGGK